MKIKLFKFYILLLQQQQQQKKEIKIGTQKVNGQWLGIGLLKVLRV